MGRASCTAEKKPPFGFVERDGACCRRFATRPCLCAEAVVGLAEFTLGILYISAIVGQRIPVV